MDIGATELLCATATDQFGNALAAPPPLAWTATAGTIATASTTNVDFTAPGTSAQAAVAATCGVVSGNVPLNVADQAPTVATAAAASPAEVTGTTTTLSVLGADDGGQSNLTYTWSLLAETNVVRRAEIFN